MRSHDWKLLILPSLSGVLQFASFPALNLGYVAWVAHVPLVIFLARCRTVTNSFLGGFVAGFVQLAMLLYWIPGVLIQYGSLPGILSWLLHGLLMLALAVYPALASAMTGLGLRRGGAGFLLMFPFTWVSAEFLRNYTPFGGFPWLLTGYSQSDCLGIIQIADITGIYGVSFLVVSVNVAVAWAVTSRTGIRRRLLPVLAAGVLIVLSLTYGFASLRRWNSDHATRRAALLQGNILPDAPDRVLEWKFRQGYVRMAESLRHEAIDLLVLPESPSPMSFQYDRAYREEMRSLATRFALGLVLSNIAFPGRGDDAGYFNSAYFLGADGRTTARYDKIHLVPFGEYVPLKRLFFFLESITREASDFRSGREFTVVSVDGHRMSAIICFEAVFPDLARSFTVRGSELLINLTNDAWYGDTSAPHQHLAMARWRAIENRRWLLRAANSGITAVVDPAGRVKASTGLFKEEVCIAPFDFVSHLSLYSRCGDVCAILCVMISCLAMLRLWLGGSGQKPRQD